MPATAPAAGIGLRAPHYAQLWATRPPLGFLEVHAENFFGAGGQPRAWLERFRGLYEVSVHGVGLSLGSVDPLDRTHLARLADPAAPLATDPPAAEQRYRRHYLLLWQAERAVRGGWDDVAQSPPDQWYCRKAARLFTEQAKELVRGPDANLLPAEIDRRLADSRLAEAEHVRDRLQRGKLPAGSIRHAFNERALGLRPDCGARAALRLLRRRHAAAFSAMRLCRRCSSAPCF